MTHELLPRKPRFQIGDRVRTVGPSVRPRKDNSGTVIDIVGPPENAIYRYRVTFADGTSELLFGFELALLES